MKTLFTNLVQEGGHLNANELSQKVDQFIDFIIVQQDEALLSVSKGWSSHGTWKASVFVNEYHYGDDLAKIIKKSINGTVTHNEEKEFTLEDFRERLGEEIFEYIYHYDFETEEE